MDTAICRGDEFRVEAEVTGGDVLNYAYSWSPDQGNVIAFIAAPNQTRTIPWLPPTAAVTRYRDLVVFVKPSPTLSFATSDSACLENLDIYMSMFSHLLTYTLGMKGP